MKKLTKCIIVFIGVLPCLFLTSCDSGSVRFDNGASDPYELFIDEQSRGVIEANTFTDISVEAGIHTFRVVQTKGYIVYPTEYKKTANVEMGKSFEMSWGNAFLR